MKKTLHNKKGFTLAELLIVVAIIAVLVAIAIPIFTGQLNKSKFAVDEANARSIYAQYQADYLANGGKQSTTLTDQTVNKGSESTLTVDGNTYKFTGISSVTIKAGTSDAAPSVSIDGGAYGKESWPTAKTGE